MYIFTYLKIYVYIHTHVAGYKKVVLKMLLLFSPVCARVYIYIYICIYISPDPIHHFYFLSCSHISKNIFTHRSVKDA